MPTKPPSGPRDRDERDEETADFSSMSRTIESPPIETTGELPNMSSHITLDEWKPPEPIDPGLDELEYAQKLSNFETSLNKALEQIPKGLQSRNQEQVLEQVGGLATRVKSTIDLIQNAKNPKQKMFLAHEVARLNEEVVDVLTNFFCGIYTYYKKNSKQMVVPRYVCWMYAHIFHGFKHHLYPLLSPIKKSFEGKSGVPDLKTVNVPNLGKKLEIIRGFYGLPSDLSEDENGLIHVEDQASSSSPLIVEKKVDGKRVVWPEHAFDETGLLTKTNPEEFKGKNPKPPSTSTGQLPRALLKDQGLICSIFSMREFDEDGEKATDGFEEPEFSSNVATIGMAGEITGDSPTVTEPSDPQMTAGRLWTATTEIEPLTVEADSDSIDEDSIDDPDDLEEVDDGPEGFDANAVFNGSRIDDEALAEALGGPVENPEPRDLPADDLAVLTEIPRKKTRGKLLAWAAAAGLTLIVCSGAGTMLLDHIRGNSGDAPPDDADAPALAGYMPGGLDAGDMSAGMMEQIDEITPDFHESSPPQGSILEVIPDLEVTPDTDVTPDSPDDLSDELIEAGPGNWPWNILQDRVAEKHGDGNGGLTPEGHRVLSQMNADLLAQAAATTNFIADAEIPMHSADYLQKTLPTLDGWGWDLDTSNVSNLAELVEQLPQSQADYLVQTLASTRLDQEEIQPLMELAQAISFPGEAPIPDLTPDLEPDDDPTPSPSPDLDPTPEITPDNQSPTLDTASPDGFGDAMRPYDAPDAPEHLFKPEKEIPKPQPAPEMRPSVWDDIEQPSDLTDVPEPVGMLREQYPEATQDEAERLLVGEDIADKIVVAEPVREQRTAQLKPVPASTPAPKFEAVRKRGAVETVVDTVAKKARGIFGWAKRKLSRVT
jgi:hypothetical protein